MNIICFGDSNTFGYDHRSYLGGRYEECWVDILSSKTGWNIENQGINGQQIPCHPICIPENTDLLLVMLGSNDLLQGATAIIAADRMEAFLKCLSIERDRILLIAPPAMKIGEWVPNEGLIAESKRLPECYRTLSVRLGTGFADAGEWNIGICFDGVHFTEMGHRAFAQGLYKKLKSLNT